MSDNITREQPDARPFEERVISILNELRQDMRALDDRVRTTEARNYDTKPLWERALAEVVETRQDVARVEQRQVRLEENQAQFAENQVRLEKNQILLQEAVERGFRSFDRKFDVFTKDLIDLRERIYLIEEHLRAEN